LTDFPENPDFTSVEDDDTDAGRERNRRVEVAITATLRTPS
jgi:flagellar motor protein MotB